MRPIERNNIILVIRIHRAARMAGEVLRTQKLGRNKRIYQLKA